jgi:hypothetical protein
MGTYEIFKMVLDYVDHPLSYIPHHFLHYLMHRIRNRFNSYIYIYMKIEPFHVHCCQYGNTYIATHNWFHVIVVDYLGCHGKVELINISFDSHIAFHSTTYQ